MAHVVQGYHKTVREDISHPLALISVTGHSCYICCIPQLHCGIFQEAMLFYFFVAMEGCESQVACRLNFTSTDAAHSELFHLFWDELSIVITCDLTN